MGFRGFGVGFRGGVVMHAPRMETWHATARTLPHAHSSKRLQGFRGGFRGGVVMTCAPHGNVARHSKDTSTCTLLYLETSGFRGGVSGWGFGVGFRGFGVGFRGGVVMHAPRMETWHATARTLPHAHSSKRLQGFRGGFRGGVVMTCAPHGNVARHSKDTSTCTLLYLETSGFRGFGVGLRGGVGNHTHL